MDVRREQTQPQRAKSQREACATTTYPISEGLGSQGREVPWETLRPRHKPSKHTLFLLVSLLSSPKRAWAWPQLLPQHRKATGILDAAESVSWQVTHDPQVSKSPSHEHLGVCGELSGWTAHPHRRTRIMILSVTAAISQAQVATNNFQSKYQQDLCHYPIYRKNLGNLNCSEFIY